MTFLTAKRHSRLRAVARELHRGKSGLPNEKDENYARTCGTKI